MKYSDYRQQLEADPEFRQANERLQHRFALGDAMIAARIHKGWSQSELARQVGTQQANISRIEAGLANPTLDLVARICRALELELVFTQKTDSVESVPKTSYRYKKTHRPGQAAFPAHIADEE